MKQTDVIANETKFQEWLAAVFESKRQRLHEETATHESRKCTSFEVVTQKYNEGDTAS